MKTCSLVQEITWIHCHCKFGFTCPVLNLKVRSRPPKSNQHVSMMYSCQFLQKSAKKCKRHHVCKKCYANAYAIADRNPTKIKTNKTKNPYSSGGEGNPSTFGVEWRGVERNIIHKKIHGTATRAPKSEKSFFNKYKNVNKQYL